MVKTPSISTTSLALESSVTKSYPDKMHLSAQSLIHVIFLLGVDNSSRLLSRNKVSVINYLKLTVIRL